jgi:hypothetical protein
MRCEQEPLVPVELEGKLAKTKRREHRYVAPEDQMPRRMRHSVWDYEDDARKDAPPDLLKWESDCE